MLKLQLTRVLQSFEPPALSFSWSAKQTMFLSSGSAFRRYGIVGRSANYHSTETHPYTETRVHEDIKLLPSLQLIQAHLMKM